MQVTNLQNSSMFFHGPTTGNGKTSQYEIPPGQTVDLPKQVWERYKDRDDIKAMDGSIIAIGGISDADRAKLPTPTQMAMLQTERDRVEIGQAELRAEHDRIVGELAAKEEEVEHMRKALETERQALREERAALNEPPKSKR